MMPSLPDEGYVPWARDRGKVLSSRERGLGAKRRTV
jgi:hypothetical protein